MNCCCQKREVVTCDSAPKAIGPYSAAIKTCGKVYVSGQIGLDPETGFMVEGGVPAQTRQVLKNMSAILESAGSSLQKVVKTTVFLTDMADFSQMNTVYAEFFVQEPPARSAIQVVALPKGALVEIEAIAVCSCDEHEGNCCK